MPRRRTTTTRKKTYRRPRAPAPYKPYRRRRYKKNKPTTKRINIPTGISDKLMTKLKYSTQVDLLASTAVGQVYVFRGNSLYDPDYTATGGQPLSFDQWAQFYNYYKVHGSKIRVTFMSQSSNITHYSINCVFPDLNLPTTTLSPIDIIQHPYARYRVGGVSTGNAGVTTITNYMSTKKLFGINNLDDTEYRASMVNNPVNTWYWRVQQIAADQTQVINVNCLVTITYYCEFNERVILLPS